MMAIRQVCMARFIPNASTRSMSTVVVTASMVKQLRDISGAPMMDCKKALGANDGNAEKAMDWLRAKGIARAAAGADRVAQEGLIAVLTTTEGVTLVEVNSETDFVGKNTDFHNFVHQVATVAANNGPQAQGQQFGPTGSLSTISPEQLLSQNDGALQNVLGLVVSTIRENIVIKRVTLLRAGTGSLLSTYVHGKVASIECANTNTSIVMGKSASAVCLSAPSATEAHQSQLEEHGRRIAMHVIAASPVYCNESEVSVAFIARERAIMDEQMAGDAKNTGKKEGVLEKIREGKLRKRLSEVCLTSQPYVVEDGSPAVGKFLQNVGRTIGAGDVSVAAYLRWGLGETNTHESTN